MSFGVPTTLSVVVVTPSSHPLLSALSWRTLRLCDLSVDVMSLFFFMELMIILWVLGSNKIMYNGCHDVTLDVILVDP
jgi:hypothetical protein